METSEYKILLVDDDPDILEFLRYNLEKEGFKVILGKNGFEAINLAKIHLPQLILLDIMMPGKDGIETCNDIRKIDQLKSTIIAFLTAKGEDISQITGFEAGADDYIIKPIKPKLLISRVKALLRRAEPGQSSRILETGNLKIDFETYIVTQNDKECTLPRKEFELLCLLISKPGKVFNRDEILSGVWGNEVIVGDRTIDVHVRKLRERFGDNLIRTVKGFGYKFEG